MSGVPTWCATEAAIPPARASRWLRASSRRAANSRCAVSSSSRLAARSPAVARSTSRCSVSLKAATRSSIPLSPLATAPISSVSACGARAAKSPADARAMVPRIAASGRWTRRRARRSRPRTSARMVTAASPRAASWLCRWTRCSASMRTATHTAPYARCCRSSGTATKCSPTGPSANVTGSPRATARSPSARARVGGEGSVLATTPEGASPVIVIECTAGTALR